MRALCLTAPYRERIHRGRRRSYATVRDGGGEGRACWHYGSSDQLMRSLWWFPLQKRRNVWIGNHWFPRAVKRNWKMIWRKWSAISDARMDIFWLYHNKIEGFKRSEISSLLVKHRVKLTLGKTRRSDGLNIAWRTTLCGTLNGIWSVGCFVSWAM